jgi:hypothetical protein
MRDVRSGVNQSFVPIGSIIDVGAMRRPKNFNREGVLELAARHQRGSEFFGATLSCEQGANSSANSCNRQKTTVHFVIDGLEKGTLKPIIDRIFAFDVFPSPIRVIGGEARQVHIEPRPAL